jgi:chromosome segregation ATPase
VQSKDGSVMSKEVIDLKDQLQIQSEKNNSLSAQVANLVELEKEAKQKVDELTKKLQDEQVKADSTIEKLKVELKSITEDLNKEVEQKYSLEKENTLLSSQLRTKSQDIEELEDKIGLEKESKKKLENELNGLVQLTENEVKEKNKLKKLIQKLGSNFHYACLTPLRGRQ